VAFTYQNIVDLARIPLNDKDKVRYTDDQLLSFANQGMMAFAKRRPDVFVGQYNNMPAGNYALTDLFPVDVSYVQQIADWVTARAEMSDDEFADSGRAGVFGNMFSSEAPL
jgi:hypothetical protein